MNDEKLRTCIDCHQQTAGCTTKTGHHLAILCQPCKDRQDKAAENGLNVLAAALNKIFR